jgi:hypothetical protein
MPVTLGSRTPSPRPPIPPAAVTSPPAPALLLPPAAIPQQLDRNHPLRRGLNRGQLPLSARDGFDQFEFVRKIVCDATIAAGSVKAFYVGVTQVKAGIVQADMTHTLAGAALGIAGLAGLCYSIGTPSAEAITRLVDRQMPNRAEERMLSALLRRNTAIAALDRQGNPHLAHLQRAESTTRLVEPRRSTPESRNAAVATLARQGNPHVRPQN